MSDLPAGWSITTVGEAGELSLGRQRSPKYHQGEKMRPYLRVANVFEDHIDTSDVMTMHFSDDEFKRHQLRPGDVLLNEGQSPHLLGRPAIYRGNPPEVAFTNSLIRFRPRSDVIPEWALIVFRYHMRSGRFKREARITTNIAHLSVGRLRPVEFPIPSLDEQKRIVAAVEEQFSRLDAGRASLKSAKRRISSIRFSILQSAVSGELTGGSRSLKEDGLPVGWKLSSVDEISANTRNSLAIGPFGSNLKVSDYTAQGVPLIFVRQVRSSVFGGNGARFVSEKKAEELRSHRAQAGDVLITKMGEPPGDATVYPFGYPDAIITADVIKLSVRDGVAPEYVALAINSHYVRHQFTSITRGVAQQKVSLGRLRQSIRIPMPSNEEQLLIVGEVSWRMQEIDRMESVIDAQLLRSTSLRSSILKDAFGGRLASA